MSNAAIVMLLLSATPAFAEQSMPTPRANAWFGALRPSESDPYKKLFEPQKSIQRSIERPASKPKVVCGMTLDPPICNPAR